MCPQNIFTVCCFSSLCVCSTFSVQAKKQQLVRMHCSRFYTLISSIIKSKFCRSTSLKTSHVCPSTLEYFKEWQTCLAFILEDNGGVTDQNVAEKFCLWRAKIDGGTRVAWLCKKHYEDQLN